MTLIIGHRGARNLWAENSLSGFENLREMPVEGVEFDLHLDAAGDVIVIHDATLDRTTEGTGPVNALARGAHRAINLKGSERGDVIPTLDEVLEIYAGTDFELHVELKADGNGMPYPGLEAKAAAAIDRFGLAQRSFLTSFSVSVLARAREVAPHIRTLCSYHGPDAEREGVLAGLRARLAVADVIAVEKKLLADYWDLITANAPLDRLGAWVPNQRADLDRWLDCGLRQVTTDNPDIALVAREALNHAPAS
ncbi:glycerophosphodiester phosphodiesterase family protein [Pelagibacterium mangrovi]|uniref:glycerophosphodiester phosphodiesterase family protein n=1 Tax=Pelagibacterium mangrovi TaxID=3119828 RepID=UPI002FC819C7